MTSEPGRETPATACLLFPQLVARGGGLQKAVQERASLYARHGHDVVVLGTGFSPGWHRVPEELKARGSLDPRVRVRNFFAHSRWARGLGAPPADAYAVPGEEQLLVVAQKLRGKEPLRLADTRPGARHPFRYRYFDADGGPLLTTFSGPEHKHEQTAFDPDGRAVDWSALVASWVDEELAGLTRPVLFSLQRGLNDPVLLASRHAYRRVASLHNCHYKDPEDRRSGVRPSFWPLFARAAEVDQVVCLTDQQRRELRRELPQARLRSIPYPGRPAPETVDKDPLLAVLVAQLIPRKRVDHAVRAFADVVARCPGARLEIYGEGSERAPLQSLVDNLGLTAAVTLMGYSTTVGEAQARAACALMTSDFEGFARVIGESMSRGTPVVSYDVRYGPRDLVRDGVDGLLVRRHEPADLAAAIVSLLSDPDRAAAMGRRAREVVERFPVAAHERAWLEVLRDRPRRHGWRDHLVAWRRRAARSRGARSLRRLHLGLAQWSTTHPARVATPAVSTEA